MSSMVSRLLGIACLLFAVLFAPASYATVQLDVQGGILMGATSVDVNGMLYDVQFANGSCDSLFNNCDPATFAFSTKSDADAASQALLDSVFVDGPIGNFDSDQTLTNGCGAESLLSLSFCGVQTLYAAANGQDYGSVAFNYIANNTYLDNVGSSYGSTSFDTSVAPYLNYAVWSVSSAQPKSVPEPGSLALLGIGLVGMGIVSNRKRKAQVE